MFIAHTKMRDYGVKAYAPFRMKYSLDQHAVEAVLTDPLDIIRYREAEKLANEHVVNLMGYIYRDLSYLFRVRAGMQARTPRETDTDIVETLANPADRMAKMSAYVNSTIRRLPFVWFESFPRTIFYMMVRDAMNRAIRSARGLGFIHNAEVALVVDRFIFEP